MFSHAGFRSGDVLLIRDLPINSSAVLADLTIGRKLRVGPPAPRLRRDGGVDGLKADGLGKEIA